MPRSCAAAAVPCFPTGRKWSFVPKPERNPKPKYLVVNADESEPGSSRTTRSSPACRTASSRALITAHAVEAKDVYIYIRGEYLEPFEILVAALEELHRRPGLR